MNIYTTRTGVRIGSLYSRPPHIPTEEELEIQSVLLGYKREKILERRTVIASACVAVLALVVAVIWGK